MSWVSITFSPACLGLSSTRVCKCEHAFVSATYSHTLVIWNMFYAHIGRLVWGFQLATLQGGEHGMPLFRPPPPTLPSNGYVKQRWGVLLQIFQCKTRFVESTKVAVSVISQRKTHTLKLLFLSHFRVQNSTEGSRLVTFSARVLCWFVVPICELCAGLRAPKRCVFPEMGLVGRGEIGRK